MVTNQESQKTVTEMAEVVRPGSGEQGSAYRHAGCEQEIRVENET